MFFARKKYDVFEHIKKDKKTNLYCKLGEAVSFTEGYGFTLFLDSDIRLVMYPAANYSRRNRQFDVFAADGDGDTKVRIKVGTGWKSAYSDAFNIQVLDEKGKVMMYLKMLRQKKSGTEDKAVNCVDKV